MKVYSMLDKKMAMYTPVMLAMSDGHVCRNIQEQFEGTKAAPERFPEDFDLYQVAEFIPESGVVTGDLRFVCNLSVIFKNGGSGDAQR